MTGPYPHPSAPGKKPDQLNDLRGRISTIDQKLLDLINKRAELSLEVGKIKAGQNQGVYKPFREKELLLELLKNNPGPLPDEHLRAIYREILSSSRSLQRPQKIVYLGPEGTFSYYAGLYYLGQSCQFYPQPGLEKVFKLVRNKEADLGIIPLENSLQGTVGQSLDLFLQYHVYIQAEIFCKISHSLLSKAESLQKIEMVHSHPQALQQCTNWLNCKLPWARVIPEESTALAAANIKDKPNAAAIAHPALASQLDLNILQTSIEDLPENWTRFLIIGPHKPGPGNRDKTSLLFTLQDKPGALVAVLNVLARENVNMKKLESRPLRGEKWQYVFFADVECDLSRQEYSRLLEELGKQSHNLRLLGSYPNGDYIDVTKASMIC